MFLGSLAAPEAWRGSRTLAVHATISSKARTPSLSGGSKAPNLLCCVASRCVADPLLGILFFFFLGRRLLETWSSTANPLQYPLPSFVFFCTSLERPGYQGANLAIFPAGHAGQQIDPPLNPQRACVSTWGWRRLVHGCAHHSRTSVAACRRCLGRHLSPRDCHAPCPAGERHVIEAKPSIRTRLTLCWSRCRCADDLIPP